MEWLILGHIAGDFYLQSDKIAEEKKKSVYGMIVHCVLYAIVLSVMMLVIGIPLIKGLLTGVIIGGLHAGVDLLKIRLETKFGKYGYVLFLLDQLIHILILIVVFRVSGGLFRYSSVSSIAVTEKISLYQVVIVLSNVLFCARPSAIFVALVFRSIPKTIALADQELLDDGGQEEISKIGSWIGILEREIILILGLLGQFGAIGFVLAAKSLARYKQLENKAFAEKYLVGTLLSTLIAIICTSLCAILI